VEQGSSVGELQSAGAIDVADLRGDARRGRFGTGGVTPSADTASDDPSDVVGTFVSREPIARAGWDGLAQPESDTLVGSPLVPSLAVGPGHVIQAMSRTIRITDRLGGNPITSSLNAFFGGPGTYHTEAVFAYDARHARWIAMDASWACPKGPGGGGVGYFNVAVSQTPDPTGRWSRWSHQWAGLPKVTGIGTSTTLVSASLGPEGIGWGCNESSDQRSYYWGWEAVVFDWSSILRYPATLPYAASGVTYRDSLWAVAQTPATDSRLFFVGSRAGYDSSATYLEVTGSVAKGTIDFYRDTVQEVSSVPRLASYLQPPRQPGGTLKGGLWTTASRVAWRENELYFAWPWRCQAELWVYWECLRVVGLDTTTSTPTLLRDVNIGEAGRDLYMGGVALSGDGTLHIVWNASSQAEGDFVSSYAARILPTDGSDEVGAPELVAKGTGIYLAYDFCTGRQAVAADPMIPSAVWQGAAIVTADGRWQTKISRLQPGSSDSTPPAVPGQPTVGLMKGSLLATRSPVTVSWTAANDTGDGLAPTAYVVEATKDGGGSWQVVATSTSPSAAALADHGTGTRYRVVAWDRAGNTSTSIWSATRTTSLIQQTSPAVSYRGTWTKGSSSWYSAGSVKYATARGAYASMTFTGRGVAFVSSAASNRGKANIYVNGVYQATVNLYSASGQYRRVVWAKTWPTAARRTIKVVVVGTSGRPRVDVDAFIVLR
jgi:hypothetical protein